ncbi:hypothetical protein EYR40_009930 [Pleurotus pulmonarius]|nr:hypothetical protein EYR40_009930 [Pleurotus pulmonarius]
MSAPAPPSTEPTTPNTAAAAAAPNASPTTGYTVEIKPNFRGAVRATTNSSGFQRATFTLIDKASGREIASSIFIGHGARSPMTLESNGAPVWKFVGRPEARLVKVFIEHAGSPTGKFTPSKLAKPVTIKKEPDDGHNEEYYFSVFLSEDWTDNDYDDGVVTITQWK